MEAYEQTDRARGVEAVPSRVVGECMREGMCGDVGHRKKGTYTLLEVC
jgi:hypothetical protein